MFHKLFVHITWTTRDRAPLIDLTLARFLTRFLRQVGAQERARVLEIGMVADHVHILVRLHPTTAIPRLMQRMKGGSAVLGTTPTPGHSGLRWAKGYSLHSVNPKQLGSVRDYLRAQPSRHPHLAIPGWTGDIWSETDPSELEPPSTVE
jgi:REP element-mobilizing transposase RayT